MITSKQRKFLKAMVHPMDPTVYIGKNGLTENTIKEMDNYLRVHELVKVKLQDGCLDDPKELANLAAEKLGAEFVQAIGRKFSLYRASEDHIIVLPR